MLNSPPVRLVLTDLIHVGGQTEIFDESIGSFSQLVRSYLKIVIIRYWV